MNLNTVKAIIKSNETLLNDSMVRSRFNAHAQTQPNQDLGLLEVSELFGTPVRTYNQHVHFANLYGIDSFRYKSVKTNKIKKKL